MSSQRIFSVEEAEALLPKLSAEFENVARLRRHVDAHLSRLAEGGVRLDAERPLETPGVPEALRPDLVRLQQLVEALAQTVERIAQHGCVVKDLELGLVDFYSVRGERPVWLCWQYGEPHVAFFHGLEEGFAGRRPLDGAQQSGIVYN